MTTTMVEDKDQTALSLSACEEKLVSLQCDVAGTKGCFVSRCTQSLCRTTIDCRLVVGSMRLIEDEETVMGVVRLLMQEAELDWLLQKPRSTTSLPRELLREDV